MDIYIVIEIVGNSMDDDQFYIRLVTRHESEANTFANKIRKQHARTFAIRFGLRTRREVRVEKVRI